jgi:TRAP-type C4-dicarboxylate transport system substrate-binding protein
VETPLTLGEKGYRKPINSKKAIKSPDDLKDMNICELGSPLLADARRVFRPGGLRVRCCCLEKIHQRD